MLQADERWVIFMEAGIRWVPHTAPPDLLGMEQVASMLADLVGQPAAYQVVSGTDGSMGVRLDAVTFIKGGTGDPSHACFLFSFCNLKGADPGFQHVRTGQTRIEAKKQGEANAASAHLVVRLSPHSKKVGIRYRALLEDVTGIGKTKIVAAVSGMLNSTHRFPFKDSEGVTRAASARFELYALDETQITEDSKGAVISHFMLVKETRKGEAFDEDGFTHVVREELKLRPAKGESLGESLVHKLKKLIGRARDQDYSRIRVQYSRKDGKNRSVTYGTHREDAEDFLIKKIDQIKLDQPLAQASAEISEELMYKMVGLLEK